MADLDDVIDELRELNATLRELQFDVQQVQHALNMIEVNTSVLE